jgi:hypothetical protein
MTKTVQKVHGDMYKYKTASQFLQNILNLAGDIQCLMTITWGECGRKLFLAHFKVLVQQLPAGITPHVCIQT